MVSRRNLLKILGGSAMALSSIGLLTHLGRLGMEQSRAAASPPGGYWFEKIATEPSSDDVVLEFVDENGNPVDFSAFLIWEPTGDVEEVAIKNGKLKLPKKRLMEQADQWRDELKRADQPTLTENTLFAVLPISIPAESLPYTTVIETPRIVNKRYKVRGVGKRPRQGSRFATCPEGRVIYVSDANLNNYVPVVALKDESSKAFGEFLYYLYYVDGGAVKFNVYGGTALDFGAKLRISDQHSWSTGDLKTIGSLGYVIRNDGESAAIMFYSTVWRYIVYEVYDVNTCGVIDQRADMRMLYLSLENRGFAIRGGLNPPSVIFDRVSLADTRSYVGIDGKGGNSNTLSYVEFMNQQPLLDLGLKIRLGGGWPIGAILNYLQFPYSWLVKELHIGFSFQLFEGKANYVTSIGTDANPGVGYTLEIYQAPYIHYLKDYPPFKPLRTTARIVD